MISVGVFMRVVLLTTPFNDFSSSASLRMQQVNKAYTRLARHCELIRWNYDEDRIELWSFHVAWAPCPFLRFYIPRPISSLCGVSPLECRDLSKCRFDRDWSPDRMALPMESLVTVSKS